MEKEKSLILENVSVKYRKQNSMSTAELIKSVFSKKKPDKDFLALKNISFSLEKGDMLGVIGKNGAGKSTMMKAISGTISPAEGKITKHGRLCALLELATGFDKDMTVKENVYLRGALLGYSREYIDSRYDEIIDFADMREFQDNPFRTLSSGMKSRIAFSIASMVEPDIIILDEIFAVGDGQFRQKSQERMQRIVNSGETTALIVSHSLTSVRAQCNKVLWLDKGRMVMFGDPTTVCDAYKKYLDTGVLPQTETLKAAKEKLSESKTKKLRSKRLAQAAIMIMLVLCAVAGGFVWAQYDLLKAYVNSKSYTAEEALVEVSNRHAALETILGVDSSLWNESIFQQHVEELINGDLSYSDVAKEVLRDAGTVTSENYRYSLAAAEIDAIKYVYKAQLESLVDEMRTEFNEQPEGKYRSLIVYSYTNCDRFYELEEQCDDAVQDIVEDIRAEARKNGDSEDIADRVWNCYKYEKQMIESYFCIRLQ